MRELVSRYLYRDFDFVLQVLGMLHKHNQLNVSLINHTINLLPGADLFIQLNELKQLNIGIESYNTALKRLSGISREQCVELFDTLAAANVVNSNSYKYVVKSILNYPINTSRDYVIVKRLYQHIDTLDETLVHRLIELFTIVDDAHNVKLLYDKHKLLIDNISLFKVVNYFTRVDINLARCILDEWLRFNQTTPSMELLELKLSRSQLAESG